MKTRNLKILLEEIDSDIVLAGEPEKVTLGQFSDQEKRVIELASDNFIQSIQKAAHQIAGRIEEKYPHLKPTDPGDPSPVIIELMKNVLEKLSSAGKPPPFEF